jgi:hypothetical protein
MAIVNQVQKKAIMSKWDLVKFQFITHCYLNKITMSDSDLNCLTLLSLNEPIELTEFCYEASSEESWIFKSPQTVRNSIKKSEKFGLVQKDSENKKKVRINPELKIQVSGNILLDYKFFANGSQEE